MSGEEYEWHQLENRANLEKALQPPTDKQAEIDKVRWNKFIATRSLSAEQAQVAKDALDRLCREYPAFVNNQHNQEELSGFLVSNNQLPRWNTVLGAYLELASTGRLMLNPAAFGFEFEQRYGDELFGAYAMSRVSADDLKRMTTPFRTRQADDESKLSADEYWKAHPELARARYGDAYYIRPLADMQREAGAFLASNPSYEQTDSNRDKLIEFLKTHRLPFTAQSLQQAFDTLKNTLDLNPNRDVKYGTTRVIDLLQ